MNCAVLRCVSLSVGRRLALSENTTTKNGIRTLGLGNFWRLSQLRFEWLFVFEISLLLHCWIQRRTLLDGGDFKSTSRDDSEGCVKFESVSEGDDWCAALKLAGVCIVGKCQMLFVSLVMQLPNYSILSWCVVSVHETRTVAALFFPHSD